MDRDTPRRLQLELDGELDLIQGRLLHEGKEQGFTGWIELVEALEAARRGSGPATDGMEAGDGSRIR